MAYIGNIPAEKYQTLQKQSFTTSATDTYTLSYSVTNPQDLALFINNVRQNPNDAYTVSGTTLTLSSAITSSDTMYAVFLGRAVETIAPATGSVTNAMLAGSIDESKLAGSIPTSKISGSLGKIGQVVQATDTTSASQGTSAGQFYGVGAGVQITPTSTSSKIIVMPSLSIGNNADGRSITRLVRTIGATSTNLLVNTSGSNINGTFGGLYDSDGNVLRTVNFCFVDSPNTTSQCTYTTQIGCNTSSTLYINRSATNNVHGSSAMVCMEVLA
jgi:hypothetical protein